MTNEHQLGLACTSCRFAHYLTLDSVVVRVSAALEGEEDSSNESLSPQEGQAQLLNCLSIHAMALSLCEMDVFEDLALIRCAECRRQYALTVSAFETHQK